jgi:hypothetical protein
VRRRDRPTADPEVVEALAVLDRYKAMLEALREAGDPWAAGRLHILSGPVTTLSNGAWMAFPGCG